LKRDKSPLSDILADMPNARPTAMSPRRVRAMIAVVGLALMMVVSAVSGLNVALPDLARETGATQSELQWIVDSYTVALAGLLFVAGAIGDRHGRRGILLVGLVIFGAAAATAMLANGPLMLIIGRGFMGVGAAAVMPTTLSVITTSVPEEMRAKAVGLWVGIAGGGAVLGLIMSGLLLQWFGWSSFFALNVAMAALAFVGALVVIPNSVDEHPPAIDPVGAGLSFIAIGSLVFGIIEGPVEGWTSPRSWGAIVLGIAAGFLFMVVEARSRAPMLDPRLFRIRAFSAGSVSNTVQFFCAFGFFFTSMQYLQFVVGFSPLKASVAVLPMSVAVIPIARQAPVIAARVGFHRVGSTGLLLMAVALVMMSRLTVDLNYWLLAGALVVFGAGMGFAGAPATTAITGSLPRSKQGVASAMNDTTREVGSALGIAVLGSVLNATYRSGVESATAGLPSEAAEAAQSSIAAATEIAAHLGPAGAHLGQVANASFVDGFTAAMLVAAVCLVAAALFVFVRARSIPDSESAR